MGKYYYEAVSLTGEYLQGIAEEVNKHDFIHQMELEGNFVTALMPAYLPSWMLPLARKKKVAKLKTQDLSNFFTQLGGIIDTGLDIPVALAIMMQQGTQESKTFARELFSCVREGNDLDIAFKKNIKFVGKSYDSFIKIGIDGGRLGEVLLRIGQDLESTSDDMAKLITTIIRPLMSLGMMIAVMIYVFAEVVPEVLIIGETVDQPITSGFAFTMSTICSSILDNLGFIIIGFGLIGILVTFLIKGPLNYQWHKLISSLIVSGQVIIGRDLSDFYKSLSIGLYAGMSTLVAYNTALSSVSNKYLLKLLTKSWSNFSDNGTDLVNSLKHVRFITPLELRSLETGRRTGQLCEMLDKMSNMRMRDVRTILQRVNGMMEPSLTIVNAIFTLIMMLGTYEPIFKLTTNMKF